MDIHELTYFKKVAELQHMTRAAQELRVAQPALSRTISGLEQELGVKLFERKGKSIALNQYGTILLQHTQRILQEMAEIERDLSEAKGEATRTVTITLYAASKLLPRLVMEAVARAVKKSCGLDLEQRPPNDLFFNNRKVVGILVESMFHNSDMQWAVMGIGVNVNVPSEALPEELAGVASSLYAETGTAFSVSALLRHILEALEARLDAEKLPDDVPFSQTKNGPEERR